MAAISETLATTEQGVTERLRTTLPALLPNITILRSQAEARLPNGVRADLLVEAQSAGFRILLVFEVKSNGEPRIARTAVTQLAELSRSLPGAYPVFAAPFINETSRDICKRAGIGYLDLLGNVFIQAGPVLIERQSRRTPSYERRAVKSVFAPKASRVTRFLLMNPKIKISITQLARECAMSPAGAFRAVEGLELRGYVERDAWRRVALADPARLLTDWAASTRIESCPRSLYFSLERSPAKILEKMASVSASLGIDYAATLMAGASLIAPFVRFDDVWVYTAAKPSMWMSAMDLQPTESGANVVLIQPPDDGVFFGTREINGIRVVSDPQLYVDLYNFPARGREQADYLRQARLGF